MTAKRKASQQKADTPEVKRSRMRKTNFPDGFEATGRFPCGSILFINDPKALMDGCESLAIIEPKPDRQLSLISKGAKGSLLARGRTKDGKIAALALAGIEPDVGCKFLGTLKTPHIANDGQKRERVDGLLEIGRADLEAAIQRGADLLWIKKRAPADFVEGEEAVCLPLAKCAKARAGGFAGEDNLDAVLCADKLGVFW
jgi:hypothetical protein